MERKPVYAGWIVISGTIGFVLIVVFLQIVQPNYNPLEQQMSELALGKFGSFMVLAFSSFALATFALQFGLRRYPIPIILRFMLIVAACGLFGAGFFRIDTATDIHIAFVSIAFVLIVLVMVLLPRHAPVFKTSVHIRISWALGAGAAVFVSVSQSIVPMGLGQRGSALCIFIWLVWMGRSLICNQIHNVPDHTLSAGS